MLFRSIADDEGVEATVIGNFTGDGRIELAWKGQAAGSLDCHFLHEGRPRGRLASRSVPAPQPAARWDAAGQTPARLLPRILALPDVASKEWIVRQYDHEVQGTSVVKPLVGKHGAPGDAAVIQPVAGNVRGVAIGNGLATGLASDPYWMGLAAIDE